MASSYLTRTFSGASNTKTWTFSAWIKKTNTTAQQLLSAAPASTDDQIYFSSDQLVFYTGNIYLLILTIVIVLREISISSLRLFLVSNGVEISKITPDKFGKLKTFLQMFSLSLLLVFPLLGNIFFIGVLILLLISTFFSIISFINYLKIWSSLEEK